MSQSLGQVWSRVFARSHDGACLPAAQFRIEASAAGRLVG